MIISRIILTIALLLLLRSPGRAQDEPYYFYRGLDFGSEALVNPISLTINGGFGILQYGNLSRDVSEIRYGTGFHNVFANLSHPGGSISEYGWGDFMNWNRSVLTPVLLKPVGCANLQNTAQKQCLGFTSPAACFRSLPCCRLRSLSSDPRTASPN